jgi:hypothetical protein
MDLSEVQEYLGIAIVCIGLISGVISGIASFAATWTVVRWRLDRVDKVLFNGGGLVTECAGLKTRLSVVEANCVIRHETGAVAELVLETARRTAKQLAASAEES